uniref:Uncharacterized protein n=1 Tax=Brassica oleracea var. oleracea TaxID=109376 RepID=A0A0D3CE84_BRAOL
METEIGNQETARSTSLICDPVMADSIDKMAKMGGSQYGGCGPFSLGTRS